jgi:hypothetical protein
MRGRATGHHLDDAIDQLVFAIGAEIDVEELLDRDRLIGSIAPYGVQDNADAPTKEGPADCSARPSFLG